MLAWLAGPAGQRGDRRVDPRRRRAVAVTSACRPGSSSTSRSEPIAGWPRAGRRAPARLVRLTPAGAASSTRRWPDARPAPPRGRALIARLVAGELLHPRRARRSARAGASRSSSPCATAPQHLTALSPRCRSGPSSWSTTARRDDRRPRGARGGRKRPAQRRPARPIRRRATPACGPPATDLVAFVDSDCTGAERLVSRSRATALRGSRAGGRRPARAGRRRLAARAVRAGLLAARPRAINRVWSLPGAGLQLRAVRGDRHPPVGAARRGRLRPASSSARTSTSCGGSPREGWRVRYAPERARPACAPSLRQGVRPPAARVRNLCAAARAQARGSGCATARVTAHRGHLGDRGAVRSTRGRDRARGARASPRAGRRTGRP